MCRKHSEFKKIILCKYGYTSHIYKSFQVVSIFGCNLYSDLDSDTMGDIDLHMNCL